MVFFVFHFILLQSIQVYFTSDENISGAVLNRSTEERLEDMGIE
jgi:hypothetical protein